MKSTMRQGDTQWRGNREKVDKRIVPLLRGQFHAALAVPTKNKIWTEHPFHD
jgi:hypothetical protein